jgi:hypothetical protein
MKCVCLCKPCVDQALQGAALVFLFLFLLRGFTHARAHTGAQEHEGRKSEEEEEEARGGGRCWWRDECGIIFTYALVIICCVHDETHVYECMCKCIRTRCEPPQLVCCW